MRLTLHADYDGARISYFSGEAYEAISVIRHLLYIAGTAL